ncbi:MAG: hypothetical protein J6Y64_01315, partial [Ruminococcus sp.]|nr:hypothetical protein [Ruminococcus sp.]
MKEINEFDILENTEQSVIDRLSEEFPPDDAEEKEKVFRMSEEKFNKANSTYTETDEQVVSGVEVYRKPVWKKCLSAAAAAVILIGGTAGGIKAYKYFHNAPTKIEEEKKIAPFGDFMETKYQICDYTAEPLFTITPNNTDADEDTDDLTEFDVSIYGGNDIPEDKRQKLADFINSYDYKEVYTRDPDNPLPPHQTEKNDPVAEALLRGEEPPEPQYENLTGLDELVYAPFFICIDEDRIKSITIDETNNKGGLTYTEFSYSEENGKYLISNSVYLTKAYEIDYDLFKITINDILNSNEEETEDDHDYCYKIAPFGDFAELEYELCDFDADLSPRTIDEESVEHAHRLGIDNIVSTTYLPACTPISQDHREKLAELFNNYNFEGNITKSYVYEPERDLIILNKNGETIELDSMDSEDHSDQMHSKIFRSTADAIHLSPIHPYMIYETDDEVRFLSFYQFDDYGA